MYPNFHSSVDFLPSQPAEESMDWQTSAFSATQAPTSTISISELAVLFECPVCKDYALPPILQCKNGHHLCTTCRKRVSRCPLCRESVGRYRNLALDSLAEKMLFQCKYRLNGCTAALRMVAKQRHEMTCEYGPSRCVLGWETCKWTGPLEHLVDHILHSHGFVCYYIFI
ncbi:hypothetical protein MTO96_030559 [Rhipicephalus appendiculatus]